MKTKLDQMTIDVIQLKHGGTRRGAGRKKTTEPTVVMRIPLSLADNVKEMIKKHRMTIEMKFKIATNCSDDECAKFIDRFNNAVSELSNDFGSHVSLRDFEHAFFDNLIECGESCYFNIRIMRKVSQQTLDACLK